MKLNTKANRGKSLEAAVLASQSDVLLAKVATGARFLPGGRAVACKTLPDFVGVVKRTGRLVAFDAKQCGNAKRFEITRSSVPPHQREHLTRWGAAGGLCGLLIERTAARTYHWLDWRMLVTPPPSYGWDEICVVGPSYMAVNWRAVFRWDTAADLASDPTADAPGTWEERTAFFARQGMRREAAASVALDNDPECGTRYDPRHTSEPPKAGRAER